MKSTFATVMAHAVMALVLAGCGQAPTRGGETPKDAASPTISEEAREALARAEADVEAARAKFALWTSAEAALLLARDAAKAGDSGAVIQQSRFVAEQVKGGMAQLSYPSTEPR